MYTDLEEPCEDTDGYTLQQLLELNGHKLPTLAEARRWARREAIQAYIASEYFREQLASKPEQANPYGAILAPFREDSEPLEDVPPWEEETPFPGDSKRSDEWAAEQYARWLADKAWPSDIQLSNNN